METNMYCLLCLFLEVKCYIVNLVRKFSILYFNKIKLNSCAKEHCYDYFIVVVF